MKLITEQTFDINCLVEGKSTAKGYFITGPYLVAETKNKNGRFYPQRVLEREVEKYQHLIKEKRSISELGHPSGPTINLDRASHLVTELKFNGKIAEGKAKIMDTPMGKIAKSLIDEGVKLGVSSRGMGTLKESNGMNVVQDDYHLAAIDIVSDPSGPGCFVDGILEGKDWIWSNGLFLESDLSESKKIIEKAKAAELEETALLIFNNFISKL